MDSGSLTQVQPAEPVESLFAWIVGSWLTTFAFVVAVLLVGARLAVFCRANRDVRATREFAHSMRRRGYWLIVTVGGGVGVVYGGLRLTDDAYLSLGLVAAGLVALSVGVYAALALSVGLATSPRVDARVVSADGHNNPAWAIDVLTQIHSAHGGGESKAAASHGGGNQPDVGELITVADKSGNGMASLAAAVFQMLFNTSPWLIEVTVLDGVTATVALRRNGHEVEEEVLRLPYGHVEDDHHRELLAMAANFAAIRVAARYPDINGFYGVENWRSAALISVAMITTGPEREACLTLALEEDPSNLVAEYEELFEYVGDQTDASILMERIERLEPMIDLAAKLSGNVPVLDNGQMPWHDDASRRILDRNRKAEGDRPSRLQRFVAVRPADRNMLRALTLPEPPMMMLRLMLWYLSSVRNWLAVESAREGRLPDANAPQGDLGSLGSRVECVLRSMVAALVHSDVTPGRGESLERMRMYVAIDDQALGSWAGVQFDQPTRALLNAWFTDAELSTDLDVQHSLACLYVSQMCSSSDRKYRKDRSALVVSSLKYAHFKPYWRDWSIRDPELRLAGGDAKIREVVLPAIADAWLIERFAQVRDRTPVRAVRDPELLTDRVIVELAAAPDLTPDVVRSIAAGAAILRAARRSCLPDDQAVLRAVRHLLDEGHDLNSLRSGCEFDFDYVVDGIAEAVYWVPSAPERESIVKFVKDLVHSLDTVPLSPGARIVGGRPRVRGTHKAAIRAA